MLRKWEYLAQRCDKEGSKEKAKIARQIDAILVDIYGLEHTKSWIDDINSGEIENKFIMQIANHADYCIACKLEEEAETCENCEFGLKAGICVAEEDSLFDQFMEI